MKWHESEGIILGSRCDSEACVSLCQITRIVIGPAMHLTQYPEKRAARALRPEEVGSRKRWYLSGEIQRQCFVHLALLVLVPSPLLQHLTYPLFLHCGGMTNAAFCRADTFLTIILVVNMDALTHCGANIKLPHRSSTFDLHDFMVSPRLLGAVDTYVLAVITMISTVSLRPNEAKALALLGIENTSALLPCGYSGVKSVMMRSRHNRFREGPRSAFLYSQCFSAQLQKGTTWLHNAILATPIHPLPLPIRTSVNQHWSENVGQY